MGIDSKWLLVDTLTKSNIGASLQCTFHNGIDGKPGGQSALLRTLTGHQMITGHTDTHKHTPLTRSPTPGASV